VKLLEQAERWQAMFDSEAIVSRAELARREGVSAMLVTLLLRLTALHPAIRRWIRQLPPGTPERFVSARALASTALLPQDVQLHVVARRWPVFKAFQATCSGVAP
jgi:hypothetical protein